MKTRTDKKYKCTKVRGPSKYLASLPDGATIAYEINNRIVHSCRWLLSKSEQVEANVGTDLVVLERKSRIKKRSAWILYTITYPLQWQTPKIWAMPTCNQNIFKKISAWVISCMKYWAKKSCRYDGWPLTIDWFTGAYQRPKKCQNSFL